MNRSQSWLGLKVSREREPTTPLSAQFTALPLHQDEGAGPSTTWSSLKGVSTLEQRTEILGPGAFQGQNLPGEEVFGSSRAVPGGQCLDSLQLPAPDMPSGWKVLSSSKRRPRR